MNAFAVDEPEAGARPWRRRFLPLLVLAAFWAHPAPLRALEVDETIWGFDQRVVPHRFNLLSVRVSNPNAVPFEGVLELRAMQFSGRVGAVLAEPVFLSPFASRWVQFHPYIGQGYEEWILVWGRRSRERFELPAPPVGVPARVLLDDPGGLRRSVSPGLPRFPENLFPPSVTAADGLAAVALDQVPRWEEARRAAFLDWLWRGGTVHVFQKAGAFPEFPAELAALNAPVDRQQVGAGSIYRHARELDDSAGDLLRPPPDDPRARDEDAAALNLQYGRSSWGQDETLLNRLREMTWPEHNWLLIHALSLVFLGLVFPGCWLLGRGRADYRVTYGAVLGLVLVFSWTFSAVGKRGYHETTTVHSVALARPLPDGHYDVTAWSNVFVTDGALYTLTHGGGGRLYSTCQHHEAVRGVIRNMAEGVFEVDIPPYSSRPFAHRMKVRGEPAELSVERWAAGDDGSLRQLVIAGSDGLTRSAVPPSRDNDGGARLARDATVPVRLPAARAVYRNRIYRLREEDGRLRLTGDVQTVGDFLRDHGYNQGWSRWGAFDQSRGAAPADQAFRDLEAPLIARGLQIAGDDDASGVSLPPDRLRLFVYAPMPEEFFLQSQVLGRPDGWVLYAFDLPIGETVP